MAEPVHCGNPECGARLDEPMNLPLKEREPCSACGSMKRLYSQTLTAHVSTRATLTPVVIAATAAAAYVVAQIAVRPPSPEPGYHPQHQHGDLVGESIWFALAVAGLVAVGRAVERRWRGVTFKL
jgi:hypothetical protein